MFLILLTEEVAQAISAALKQAGDEIRKRQPVDGKIFDPYTGVSLYRVINYVGPAIKRARESLDTQ